jgi:hypothetical protein
VERVPRVDIPGDRVHFIVKSDKPFYVEPLFTRDPAAITESQILTAMLAIAGIYAPYKVQRLNHGIGFNTAAIELLLPTYGERVRLAGHCSQGLGGRLIAQRFAPPALEQLRKERLYKALDDKSPKLHAAKRSGTRTVLVLENNDIALTNESVVSEMTKDLSCTVQYMPDDIFLVGTYTTGHFYVTQVRKDGRACLLMGDDVRPWEFNTDALTGI